MIAHHRRRHHRHHLCMLKGTGIRYTNNTLFATSRPNLYFSDLIALIQRYPHHTSPFAPFYIRARGITIWPMDA